jgi:hypothetical protein
MPPPAAIDKRIAPSGRYSGPVELACLPASE